MNGDENNMMPLGSSRSPVTSAVCEPSEENNDELLRGRSPAKPTCPGNGLRFRCWVNVLSSGKSTSGRIPLGLER